MKKKLITILKYLLIALFTSYYCQSTLFLHTHTFNGETITHSHPYLPNGGHSHTGAQYQTVAFLTHFLFTVALTAAFVVAVKVLILLVDHCLHFVARHLMQTCSLRAPPSIIC
ncbi:MAG: hypothetical protein RR365_12935 [Bacteroides sp.]